MAVTPVAYSSDMGTRLTLFYRKLLTREVINQAYTETPVFNWLQRDNKRPTDSAGNWDIPVSNAGDPLGGEFDGWDSGSTAGIETATTARTRRAYYYEPVRCAKTEKWDTQGGEALARIQAHRLEMGMLRIRTKMQAHATATSQASSKAIMPIPVIIPTTPSSGTVSGIDRSVNTWWQTQTDSTGGSFQTDGPRYMEAMGRSVSLNTGTLNFSRIFTTPTIYGYMQSQARTHGEFQWSTGSGEKGADTGTKIFFHGKPVHYDSSLPSGRIYFITDRALKLHVVPGVEFMVDDDIDLGAGGQHGYVKFIYWGGNNVPYRCAELGQISNVQE